MKIRIGPDRNIYPSKNPAYQYEANAGGISIWFNRKDGESWIPGMWIHENPDKEFWFIITERINTHAWIQFPSGCVWTLNGDTITYSWGDFELIVTVGHWKIRRVIKIIQKVKLSNLSKYVDSPVSLAKITAKSVNSKELHLEDDDKGGFRVRAVGMWDSAENPRFEGPCLDRGHLCGRAAELGCKGCKAFPCLECPNKKGIIYEPNRSEDEQIELVDGKIRLKPSLIWLQNAVFPIYVNDEITGWQSIGNITLGGKYDGGNAASTLYDSITTFRTGIGGTCEVGDVAYNAGSYDTDTIALDLNGTYTVNQIKVWINSSICDSANLNLKVQYWTGSGWADFGGTDTKTNWQVEPETVYLLDFNTITERETTKVRINHKGDAGIPRRDNYINEIEIYGTAAGPGGLSIPVAMDHYRQRRN